MRTLASPLSMFTRALLQKIFSIQRPLKRSLVFCHLFYGLFTLIPLFKYVIIVLRADDYGEGGTFALYSLICRHAKVSLLPNRQVADEALSTYKLKHTPEKKSRSRVKICLERHKCLHTALLIVVLLGTCMVIGDGLLTPAISVFSAVSGLELSMSKEHHQSEAFALREAAEVAMSRREQPIILETDSEIVFKAVNNTSFACPWEIADAVKDIKRILGCGANICCRHIRRNANLVADWVAKQHVTAEGTALVKQAEDAASNKKVFVRKVIELHDKYLEYVKDCFQNHALFLKELKEAFEVFCNKGVAGSSCAELLATFCDNILKKDGSEKLSDEAIEETLEKVVKLLAYISDKDLFAEFYRKKLARRLLFDKSANDDQERSILTKLKQQFGGQFTSQMEGMVTDLTLAKESQSNFEEYLSNNPNANPGIDLTVTVLTTGFWPSYKSFDLNLPAEMVKCVEVFKEFYQTKTKHRKVTWIYSLGTCNLMGKFEPKTMELIVTTYQASALLLFNNSDRLSYSDIMAQLNLTDDDVVRLLHSLSCAKYKILNKEPNTKSISPTDWFEFNSKFTDKMRRIKVPLRPVDEKKKVIKDVDRDRRYAIDASIVRIMKRRKVLGHQQLVLECVEQLGHMFKPDIEAIKNRIEDLITRDYLERDKDNANLFRYLA